VTQASGFHLDLNLCTGCSACELACSTENELGWGHSWRRVISFNAERLPSIPSYHLSLACNHCADAPCMKACPAQAIVRSPETRAVLIESDHCIGCGYCAWACPYEAPQFDDRAGVMRKCTWCDHRLADGLEPACVEQCPTAALTFRPLEGTALVPGFPDTPAQPAIRFEPLAEGRQRGPESSWDVPREVVESFAAARPPEEPAISLRSEWPLLIFSLLASALVGWVLASVGRAEPPGLGALLGLAALAAGASTLHLGRKVRAWRALLNIRHSWLSREIALFSTFVITAAAHSGGVGPPALGFVAGGLGLLTLVSVDRVYDFVRTPVARPVHSADTLLTGLLASTLVLDEGPLALTVLAVKLALYATRHMRRHDLASGGPGWSLPAVRILLGFVLPPLLAQVAPAMSPAWAWACIGIAEIVDRAEFYNELEIQTPRRQAELDLGRLRQKAA
jgi:DMSO reductase iron-sulfur subunit